MVSPITGKLVDIIDLSQYFVIKFDTSIPVALADSIFSVLPEVIHVEKSYYPVMDTLPTNDPLFTDQWHLMNSYGNPKFDIKAAQAWPISKGDSVKIAIIDGGVRDDHEDLHAHIWYGAGSEADSGYDTTTFVGRHGTYVAGIAAAVTDNNIGVAGVAWNGLIMPRFGFFIDDYADDIYDAARNGAAVINCSWHFYSATEDLEVLHNAVRNAFSLGAVITASMGNDQVTRPYLAYPAAWDSFAIAVGSLAYVNGGETTYVSSTQNWGSFIDVTAPGENIWTTAPLKNSQGQYYTNVSGTSFSTPQVSGLAALLVSINSDLTNLQIMNIIKSTATLFAGWGSQPQYYGSGMINCYNAVKAAIATIPPPSLSSPSDGATVSSSPFLVWHPSHSAKVLSYELQVATDTNFTNVADTLGTTDSSCTVACLSFSTRYYWRVGAVMVDTSIHWSGSMKSVYLCKK